MPIAYLSLGANLGDREANLRKAIEHINELGKVTAVSSFYETEPVDFTAQPLFLNCALELQTEIPARELMQSLLAIESSMGRLRDGKKGPRLIDIDLLLFDREVIHGPQLTVPHPAMHLRDFVLVPLAEIARDAFHPVLKRSAGDLLDAARRNKIACGQAKKRQKTSPA